ncbi:MAG TPA: translocation/assembly module TamB domain-containing protein [Chthoniobacteraceae bacterium]|nr:translocation/assembly module TamB domain-containing protein [Chthoniobacteraceae bacterium]
MKWFGIVLLILAIFHRPLFFMVARVALIKIAAKHNVKLDVHFEGTIFTNLSVLHVQATPTGETPIENISIEAVRLQYSLPKLIKHGVGEFLESYELRNADLVFRPGPSKTKEATKEKKSIAEDLNNLLGQPALYADKADIENLSITVHGDDGATTEVKHVRLKLHPWEAGYLKIDRVAVPGLPAWEHIDATTSYVKRDLVIQNLVLSPELIIAKFDYDASQRAEDKGSLRLQARLFGGGLDLGLAGSKLKAKGENLEKSYDTKLTLDAGNIDLKAAAKYFGAKEPPLARLGWLKLVFTGQPEKPRTWDGNASLRVEGFTAGAAEIDGAETYINFAKGKATLTGTKVTMGPSTVSLKAVADLPESINDFSHTEGDADLSIDAPDLAAATHPFMAEAIGGVLSGGGKVGLHNRRAAVDLALSASKIGNEKLAVGTAAIKVTAVKALDQPEGAAAFDGLNAHVSLNAGTLRFGEIEVDNVAVDALMRDDLLTLTSASVTRDQNSVTAKGTYRLPRAKGAPAPLDTEFAIKAPQLESFHLGKKSDPSNPDLQQVILTGHLDAAGKITSVDDVLNGSVQIDGGDFRFGDFKAARLAGEVKVVNNEAQVERIGLQINQTDQLAVSGKVGLKEPMSYEAAVLVLFKDLAVLQPLLATFGVKESLGGALDFSVESQGKLQPQEHLGKLELKVDKAHYGKFDLTQLQLDTIFGTDFVESSAFHVATGATTLDAKLEWRDKKAKLKDINLMQGTQQALTGYILVPFDPQNKEQPVSFEQRLGANVNAKDLDIAKLMVTLGQKPPVTGTVSMNLLVAGTVLKPIAHLKINAKNLKTPAAAKFEGAEVDFVAHYSEKELTLDAAARQREIQPLVIKGRVPLDLEAAVQNKKLDDNLPIDLTVKLPPSSLAFLPKVVPVVRSISGTAAIDAHVTGTVGNPNLSGTTDVKLEYARLNNGNVPNIGKLALNLGFTEKQVTINHFNGDLGGGTLNIAGKVLLPKLNEPAFDLHIKSDKILVKRDDAVTVRIDTDLAIEGPLAGGKVAGVVYVTQSRFFKEIDILPIALPGRPKAKARPAPKSVAGPATISLPPPMDKWTFDIAIKTRPNDPFQVRGNMANGGAAVDLKFGGTGAEPYLEGVVRIENLVASLPFSKLRIDRGFVTFSKDEMLQPKLDINAESEIREYRIHIYIFGPANDPKVSMTSEPPLPQEDILSLLATGTTISELTGNSEVLAGRAASLLFQQLYHKIFKNKGPGENTPVLNRFEVEAGNVDARTGRQEIAAKVKINDNTYLLGNVDVTGAFTGRVRYLLRFR